MIPEIGKKYWFYKLKKDTHYFSIHCGILLGFTLQKGATEEDFTSSNPAIHYETTRVLGQLAEKYFVIEYKNYPPVTLEDKINHITQNIYETKKACLDAIDSHGNALISMHKQHIQNILESYEKCEDYKEVEIE